MRRQIIGDKKTLAMNEMNKGLISRIYQELLQIRKINAEIPIIKIVKRLTGHQHKMANIHKIALVIKKK